MADIVENAERIERYLDGIDRTAFAENEMILDAVERCLERMRGSTPAWPTRG